jgi:uncharacterized membrane protein
MEGEHRHFQERRELDIFERAQTQNYRISLAGMASALIFSLSMIGAVVASVYMGSPITAAVLGSFNIVGVVSAFLYSAHSKTNEARKLPLPRTDDARSLPQAPTQGQ